MTFLRLAVVSALGFALMGCPSTTTMGVARTMPAGKTQFLVNPGFVGAGNTQVGNGTPVALPQLEVGLRYAVTDTIEVGAKGWLVGGAMDAKFALLRPESEANGLNISLNPGLSFIGGGNVTNGGGAGLLTVYLPLMVGQRFSHHEVTLTPKVVSFTALGGGEAFTTVFAGGSFGFAPRLAPGFRLLPEISVLVPVGGNLVNNGNQGAEDFLRSSYILQLGLGFLFGGD